MSACRCPIAPYMPIALAPDIHLAIVAGDLVFLDARRDEYLCMGGEAAERILDRLTTGDAPPTEVEILLEAQGLLASASPPDWTPTPQMVADKDLGEPDHVPIAWLDLLRVPLACILTLLWLWRYTPARWFRLAPAGTHCSPGQHEGARAAARRFQRLRPLIPRSGRCLIRSMLLLHLLRMQRIAPSWVFGVRTHPFEAHCWLEHDGVILDDTLEHVAWFTPIVRT